MSTERRNPYVILGIPFGSSTQEARSGFARASRRIKNTPDARYTLEDLTWALHQVEQIVEDPSLAFHIYRLPANPGAVTARGGIGVFNPPPIRLKRQSPPAAPEQHQELRREAIRSELRDWLKNQKVPIPPTPYEMREEDDAQTTR